MTWRAIFAWPYCKIHMESKLRKTPDEVVTIAVEV
jgi:hypothetical protein